MVHIVVMGTHRNVEKMRNARKHTTDSFGEPVQEKDIGIWLSTDAKNEGSQHFPSRQKWYQAERRAAVVSQVKAFATRWGPVAKQSTAEGFLFLECDCLWVENVWGRWVEIIEKFLGHACVWRVGGFTNEHPNWV